MTDIQATDLPAGSVIANGEIAAMRALDGIGAVWRATNGSRLRDDQIDKLLGEGARVLRSGR